MVNGRSVLKLNTRLELRNLASGGNESFVTREVIGQGGSSVCYRAVRGNSKGLLKEFYPHKQNSDYTGLIRTEEGYLVADEGYKLRFDELKREFIESITLLSKINFSNDSDVLNNYIPSFELFEGQGTCPTVYVWCKENAGYPFSDYINEVWKKPLKGSEFKLYNILATVKTIAISIVAMHKNGLLHRDIKPDNFLLFKDGLGNIDPNNISLFDINSFSYGSRSTLIVGTEGFKAPEVDAGKANYYSDIYSIGAVLFYALTHKIYRREYYQDISDLTENSELVHTNDVYLKSRIISILQKTLAHRPTMRYAKTEDLVSALDKAIVRLLPYTESKKLDSNQKFKIIEKVNPIDAIPVFQNLLYKNPVYKWMSHDSDVIRVLVVGGGVYAQAFTDVVLQTLQVRGKRPRVTVVSDSPDYDKQIYLKYRPDLARFFDIDKKESQKDTTSFGSINYINGNFDADSDVDGVFIGELAAQINPCYILVSLGNDKLNYSVARKFADTGVKALVNFVYSSDEKKFSKVNPVYINQRTKYKNIDRNLIRMAFNTHLVWNDSIDADIDRLYHEFRQVYNFKSSIASALSIPYKLNSIGINPEDIIKGTSQIYCGDSKWIEGKMLRELSLAEHNRWVTEKLVNGWTAPLDSTGGVDSSRCLEFNGDKHSKLKQHLCIAKATVDEFPDDIDMDTCSPDSLDPLDRMSVEVYRIFKKAAEEYKNSCFLDDRARLSQVRKCLPDDNSKLIRLFNEYEAAVNSIVMGNNSSCSSKFKSLKYRLCDEINKSFVINKGDAINILDDIADKLQPAIISSRKVNYKALDDIIIKGIPFIIGSHPRPALAAVLSTRNGNNGYNGSIFANVAPSLLIVPGRIRYLYYCSKGDDIDVFIDAVTDAIEFFEKRHMKNTIEAVIVFEEEFSTTAYNKIRAFGYEKSLKLKLYENVSCAKATGIFFKECRGCLIDGSILPFDNEVDNQIYTERMKQCRYFRFDSLNMKFYNTVGCEYLDCIDTTKIKLKVEDIFALDGAHCIADIPDMSKFYRDLWNVYAESLQFYRKGVWNSLCDKLEIYHKNNDIAGIFLKSEASGVTNCFKIIMPIECYNGAGYLADELIKNKIIQTAQVTVVNSDSCMIEIAYDKVYRKVAELFSQYSLLLHKLTVNTCEKEKIIEVSVICDNIQVNDIHLSEEEYLCVEKLAHRYMINALKVHKSDCNKGYTVSFAYASKSIKKAMTVSGTALQLYVYYGVLDNGDYDDIKANVIVNPGRDEVCFDLAITKGLRSTFVLCGAQRLKDARYCKRLGEIQNRYGNNCNIIVLAEKTFALTDAAGRFCEGWITRVSDDVEEIKRIISDNLNFKK